MKRNRLRFLNDIFERNDAKENLIDKHYEKIRSVFEALTVICKKEFPDIKTTESGNSLILDLYVYDKKDIIKLEKSLNELIQDETKFGIFTSYMDYDIQVIDDKINITITNKSKYMREVDMYENRFDTSRQVYSPK